MSEHMKARTTKGLVEFKITVPLEKAGIFRKMLKGLLEMSGLERETNEEGEELYSHEEVCPDTSPATRLRGLRVREGITQQQLADSLGITQSRVAEFESGAKRISINMAKRIGQTYNLPYKAFL